MIWLKTDFCIYRKTRNLKHIYLSHMRKLILLIILFASVYTNAQKAFSVGLAANSGTDMKKQDYSNTAFAKGSAFGAFLEYKLGIPVSISLGINTEKNKQEFGYKDSSNKTIIYNHNYKYYSFPLLARIFLFKGLFYSSGFAMNILKEHEYIMGSTKTMEAIPTDHKTISCIQELGVYYALKQKFVFAVAGRYTIPMSKDAPLDMMPGMFSFNASVAYKFSKKAQGLN
jgi:hypothetical protein